MNKKQKRLMGRIIISVLLLLICHVAFSFFGGYEAGGSLKATESLSGGGVAFEVYLPYIKAAAYLVPYLIIGHDILLKAVHGIKNRRPFDENFLMAAATIGAVILSEYEESCAVMVFYQLGELFQGVAVGKSRKSITGLMDIRPDIAHVEEEGGFTDKNPEEVEPGTIIAIKPGERVPIDGTVISGESTLDTAALTGESMPRAIGPGDAVISGCINMTGLLKVRTEKEFGESTVSRILELVEDAVSRKSHMESFITRFARIYTPAVCGMALALFLLAPLVRLNLGLSPSWGVWGYRALTFLVISCPCALVISIPLSFFAAIGGAGKEGILIKGSCYLESLSNAKYVLLDKTGTLTEGEFKVADILLSREEAALINSLKSLKEGNAESEGAFLPAGKALETGKAAEAGMEEAKKRLLYLAAHAECFSSHPISRSIIKSYGREPEGFRVENPCESSGKGVTALVDGISVAVGNAAFLNEMGICVGTPKISGTYVYVAVNKTYAGCIVLSDGIKPEALRLVPELKKAGVRETIMLTGDSYETAALVAGELGMDKFYAGLMPEDKVKKVEEVLEACSPGECAVFAGDGINDAPVLMRSDVGIAMGALGSDAAIEAADIVLMDDNPLKIAKAMGISKKCMHIVYENVIFAVGIKVICLLLGALGFAGMWAAIFADVGVMVLAVLNAMRAMYIRAGVAVPPY